MAQKSQGFDRRRFLAGAAAGVGGAAVAAPVLTAGPAAADTAPPPTTASSATCELVPTQVATITPADQQYPDLTVALNPRWTATPDYVYVVDNPLEIAPIVQAAAKAGAKLTVRGGGHGFLDFVYSSDTKRIIDLTNMNKIYYDPTVNAIAVEAGAILLQMYERMYQTWGVVAPGGVCYSVGVGGHVAGGGWGWLLRRNGLIVDHLYAVEVVTVDANNNAKTILATRNSSDPNYQLFWAHTGGGGGNFGVVTRYFFKSPGVTGSDPRTMLPKPPAQALFGLMVFDFTSMTQAQFTQLIQNWAGFHVNHRGATDPYRFVTGIMQAYHVSQGQIQALTMVDGTQPNAQALLDGYQATLTANGGPQPVFTEQLEMPWLQFVKYSGTTNKLLNDPTLRATYKSAYWKQAPTATQLGALYGHLRDSGNPNPNININFSPYGGALSAVPQAATAIQHRDAAFKMLWSVQWADPTQDAVNVAWARNSYAEVFTTTGHAPVVNDVTDGCYINYVDSDMSDPTYNISGDRWSDLYYKGAYPQLQAVKKKYDPTNFFRHTMSVELPS